MAATDRYMFKSAPFRFYGVIKNYTTGNPLTGGLSSLAAQVSKDGGTFTTVATGPAEIGTTGFFRCDLSASEMDADRIIVKVTANNSNSEYWLEFIRPWIAVDSGVAQSGTNTGFPNIKLRAAAPNGNNSIAGNIVFVYSGTGAGQTRTITNYVGSTKVAIVDRAWNVIPDNTSLYVVMPEQSGGMSEGNALLDANIASLSIDKYTLSAGMDTPYPARILAASGLRTVFEIGSTTGSISDTAPTKTSFKLSTDFVSEDDYYNNMALTTDGQTRKILDFAGSNRLVTLDEPLTDTPANGQDVVIFGKFA